MKKLTYYLIASLLSTTVYANEKPNIIFILADDLGYGELGCYGQKKIKTPHLDKLCSEGMKFNYHYTGAPVCGPARAVLMTGNHLAKCQTRNNFEVKDYRDPTTGKKRYGGQNPLSKNTKTIAKILQDEGYVTGAFGKWGMGGPNTSGSPIKQGFNRFYGYNCQRNAHSFYPPYLDNDESFVDINKSPIPGHKRHKKGQIKADDYRAEKYAPHLILNEALNFIDQNKDKPFFLYLPFIEPHVALQTPQKWIDLYPKEWDVKAYRGNKGYLPHPRPRAAYAGLISHLDNHVGEVMNKLKEHQLDDNTLVIFTSDNGATFDAGGVDTQFFNSVSGLRGRKGSCYEGGIRVPCIVRWKGKIKAGSETNVVSYFPDWFGTLAEIGGMKTDDSQTGHDVINLKPVMLNGTLKNVRKTPLFWEFHGYGGIVCVRDGHWKALRRNMKNKKTTAWELYNLSTDEKEQHNVALQHPDIVKRLESEWLKQRTSNRLFKLPNIDK